MLTTVLFDMGGTLEDIWYNEDTQRATCRRLLEVLRANGLEPGCPDDVFWKRITDGVKAYKQWSEGNMLEKKPEEIWPDWYLRDFAFDREKLLPITEELANLWEVTFYHRELRDGAAEMLQALKSRGRKAQGTPSLSERLMARGRQSRHPCLDDQGSGCVDGRAQQHIRQGRADAARQGAPGWPQQISAQQHHRVPQVHVAAGGGRHLHHHSGHAGQRRKGRRHHDHPCPLEGLGRLLLHCLLHILFSFRRGRLAPHLLLPS